jgi:glycerol-3-phosphate acyltransferase PlsY
MKPVLASAAFVVGAYLLGALPHLSFLAKLRGVRLAGDFHQSLWDRAGWVVGVVGIIIELAKGALVIALASILNLGLATAAIGGLLAVCGQMWPPFSHFDGEKGNSIALGMSAALTPIAMAIALIPIVIALIFRSLPRLRGTNGSPQVKAIFGGAYSNSLPLGMAFSFITLPLASAWLGLPAIVVWCYVIMFALIMVRRLTAGLRADLHADSNRYKMIIRRLLYDRSTVNWRS